MSLWYLQNGIYKPHLIPPTWTASVVSEGWFQRDGCIKARFWCRGMDSSSLLSASRSRISFNGIQNGEIAHHCSTDSTPAFERLCMAEERHASA